MRRTTSSADLTGFNSDLVEKLYYGQARTSVTPQDPVNE